MNFSADQFKAAQKSNMEAAAGLSTTAFAGFEKLVELNMAAAKAMLTESFTGLQALGAAKDPQALLALQTEMAKPLAEKSASYGRHVYEIVSGTAAEFTKAFEAKAAESQKSATTLIEAALKNAPAGSEAVVAVFNNAITASNTAIESAKAAAKQAVQLVESNLKVAA